MDTNKDLILCCRSRVSDVVEYERAKTRNAGHDPDKFSDDEHLNNFMQIFWGRLVDD